jgi:Fic family protein
VRFPKAPPSLRPQALRVGKILAHTSPALPDGRYLHWHDLRWRPPPQGLTSEEWWFAKKLGRHSSRVEIPEFVDEAGASFWFCRLDANDRATPQLDRTDSRREMLAMMDDSAARQAYRIDQLIEEAISSSVLEGAKLTTRAAAKAMIRDGREPHERGERMVLNNYNAMLRLLAIGDRDLTTEDLLEIHGVLGDDALEVPGCAARFRRTSESVRVEDAVTGDVWFVPPPAAELPARVKAMLSFANAKDAKVFLHPLVRAIVLHFWLAYLHPFVDGNGRMARALFYWQMLRSGYDFAQYLSISGPIDRSRRSYYLSFAFTETDEGDLTYFILHQLQVLRKATENLRNHLHERFERMRDLTSAIEGTESLNRRQQAALLYAVRNPHVGLTVRGHAKSHAVTYLTARSDLKSLEALGYLRRVVAGREHRFFQNHLAHKLAPSEYS